MISFPAHSYSFHLIKLLFVGQKEENREKMGRTAARLQYTEFLYTFKVTVHIIFILIHALFFADEIVSLVYSSNISGFKFS